jgi:hypothetical protein
MRLSCLAHAGAWRAALRAHRRGAGYAAELLGARWRSSSSPLRAKRARAGGAEGASAACPEIPRPQSLGTIRSRSATERRSQRELTEQAHAIPRRSYSGQAPHRATRPKVIGRNEVPGRGNRHPRPSFLQWAWRAALRAHRRGAGYAAELLGARWRSSSSPLRAKRARAGGAEGASAACPEIPRPQSLGTIRSRSATERRSQRELTEQAHAIPRRSYSGQAPHRVTRPKVIGRNEIPGRGNRHPRPSFLQWGALASQQRSSLLAVVPGGIRGIRGATPKAAPLCAVERDHQPKKDGAPGRCARQRPTLVSACG